MKRFACMELLFLDEPDFLQRIRRARDAGYDAFEFWRWSNKDVDAIAAESARCGMPVAGFVSKPMVSLIDPASQPEFLEGLSLTVDVALMPGAPFLFIQSGRPVGKRDADHLLPMLT